MVETEAYVGWNDRAAHGYGGKITPKVTSLYKRGGTIYAHVRHTHLLINFVTRSEGIPEGVLIRAIEPEECLHRIRKERWGPRTLDVDILLYGEEMIELPKLSVPHPRMNERA
ncbi:2-amino-4-hydroxy-6-hydroxymethyldihydropteridine diphosphokinase, partial [Staphylococcus aureus]|uniref:2-amino-4-hydroxy-6- hydroxymethyldihydropteridine diphosphokinase n=1 Tax=Staphylococcus aureus TaxID=1280 RepID=UPI00351E8EC9